MPFPNQKPAGPPVADDAGADPEMDAKSKLMQEIMDFAEQKIAEEMGGRHAPPPDPAAEPSGEPDPGGAPAGEMDPAELEKLIAMMGSSGGGHP